MRIEVTHAGLRFELRIDLGWLVIQMANAAIRNRSGKAAMLSGALRIKRLK